VIDRAPCIPRAKRLTAQPAQPPGAGPVGGHDGQHVLRQPPKGGRLARIESLDKLADGGLPPDQDLRCGQPPGWPG
jgi:hypothetical protein